MWVDKNLFTLKVKAKISDISTQVKIELQENLLSKFPENGKNPEISAAREDTSTT